MRLFYTIVILVFLLAFQATGQVIHIPEDYPTIQAGIDAASEGDTVLVAPGTYYENISLSGENITLASYFLTTNSPAYISITIIDGNQNGSVITIDQGENASTLVEGFTITNGSAQENGGGIFIYMSSPTINDCIIHGNIALTGGGGIFMEAPYNDFLYPHLNNLRIKNNTAAYGGGIAVWNYIKPVLKGITVCNNTAGHGGGIHIGNTDPTFDAVNRCNIYQNSAATGNDLEVSYAYVDVIVDTFTVMDPTGFHAENLERFTFDILNSKFTQVTSDLFVSPDGDNANSGLTSDDPLKTIHHALSILLASESDQRQINLLDGTYSPEINGEFFPVSLPDYVHLSGTADSLVILDADSSARVMQILENDTNHISDLTLKGGLADDGAGLFLQNTDPHLERLRIVQNTTTNDDLVKGGGIYCDHSDPAMNDLTISGNHARHDGGGIYLSESHPRLQNVIVKYNSAGSSGGGIWISETTSKLVFDQVTIDHNQAGYGAGIFNSGILELNDCTVSSNNGSQCGGGVYTRDSTWIFNTSLTNNSSGKGAGLYVDGYTYVLFDTADLSGNIASGDGGGLYCREWSTTEIRHVNILDNISHYRGGGIYFAASFLHLKGSTIAYNHADENGGGIYGSSYISAQFDSTDRCNIYLNSAGYANDIMAQETIKVIVDTFSVMDPTDYHIGPLQNFRFDILNAKVAQADADLFVSPVGSDDNNGLTSEEPLKTINRALLIMKSGSDHQHTIHLANGIYSHSTNGERFPLQMSNFSSLVGESRDLTILDAEDSSQVINISHDTIWVISNLTVTGGNLHSGAGISSFGSVFNLYNLKISGNSSDNFGGGIGVFSGDIVNLENMVFENNYAVDGGGISAMNSRLSLKNVDFISNSAFTGAGIYLENSDTVMITKANFTGNSSTEYGGGIYSYGTDLVITDAVFEYNDATRGGGIWAESASLEIRNAILAHNLASNGYGSAVNIYNHQSPYGDYDLKFINSTFTENTYPALYLYSGDARLINDIIWDNEGPYQVYYLVTVTRDDTLTVSNSDIQDGKEGIFDVGPAFIEWLSGNINEDPQFLFSGDQPYSLDAGSACIDAGTSDTTGLYLPYNDIIGNTRVWDGDGNGVPVIDMGPYEYGAPVTVYENTDPATISSSGIVIFPNPAKDQISILCSKGIGGRKAILLNSQGQVVNTIIIPSDIDKLVINTGEFNQGIYTLIFSNESGIYEAKKILIIN